MGSVELCAFWVGFGWLVSCFFRVLGFWEFWAGVGPFGRICILWAGVGIFGRSVGILVRNCLNTGFWRVDII